MYILKLSLICLIANQVTGQNPPTSACPEIFKYEYNGTRWLGVVEAPNPPPYGSRMQINVKMAVRSQIPTDYIGKVELYDDIYVVVQKISNGQPIKYKVSFPNVLILPEIIQVTFVNEVICQGPPILGGVVTLIDLEHMLDSGESALKNSPKNKLVYIPLRQSDTPLRIANVNTLDTSLDESVINSASRKVCGRVAIVNRMLSGDIASQGEWPWVVAIFFKKPAGLDFKCAGTLISEKYIVTAAHCVTTSKVVPMKPANIILRLGVYNLHSWTEDSAVTRSVSRVKVHGAYSIKTVYSHDIAMLEMNTPVTFTDYIRPVCLWMGNNDLNNVVGQNGVVVGWGRDETGSVTTPEPKMSEVPIVSQSECLSSKADFFSLTSNETLCAGKRDGTGPCNGDSGGGLYLQQGDRWTLRGIVSISLKDSETGSCNLNEYIVYTDASKYTSWINSR